MVFLCTETEIRMLGFVTLVLQLLCSLVTQHKLLDLFELKSVVAQSFAPLSRDFDFAVLDHRNTQFRKGLNSDVHPRTRYEGPEGEYSYSSILS